MAASPAMTELLFIHTECDAATVSVRYIPLPLLYTELVGGCMARRAIVYIGNIEISFILPSNLRLENIA